MAGGGAQRAGVSPSDVPGGVPQVLGARGGLTPGPARELPGLGGERFR